MGKPFGAAVEVPFLAPGVNPPSGSVWLFPKSDGKWYSRSSAGVETLIGSNASDLTTGTVAIGRIPTGTTSVTVSLGDHLHTGVYEPAFAAGTTAQYRRGDKTWQTLDKTAVGLANVPNTDATNMANAASGTLATARGGTGITTAPVVGGVAYGASTSAFGHTAAGTAKQVLQSNGAAAPTWVTLDLTYLPDAWVKKSARLATTANIDLTTGGLLTIDGVVTVAGDRVLVKNQSAPAQNGIYSAAVSTWTRTPGADTAVEVAGATVVVDQGTQGGQLWHTLFKSTDTLGTTAMNWYRAVDTSMSGVAGGYEAFVTAGTTAQYYRGDKTWQTLDKTAVGLANVPNVDSQNATNLTTGTVAIGRLPTGQTSVTVPLGNDARFTDSRTPTGTAGGSLTGTYPNPTIAALAVTDAAVATANKDGAVGTASMRTLGTGAQQAAAGNHGHALTDAGITGTLAIAKGGTNTTATPTAGGITYGTGTALAHTAAGTAGQFLKSAAAGAPTWNTLTLTDLPDAWVKKSVRAATTANITLSAPQTIDGIAVVAGDRVLVKNQTTTSGNGIYAVAAGAWTRTTDADVAVEVAGATVSVDEGAQGGQIWTTTFKSTDTLGTTGMVWYKVVDTSQVGVSGGVEAFVVAGTTSQYWRGDKTWQALFDATLPAALGTAAVGTAATTARRDHVHAMPTAAQVGAAATSHTHVATTDLTATGTKDSTTFLRGDNTWAPPSQSPQAAVIGQITQYGGGTVPYGWLLCDGTAQPRATYAELFTAIGTTYGAGDGSTTFNMPDLRGRVAVGLAAVNANLNAAGTSILDNLGESGGAVKRTLQLTEMPQHTHTIDHGHTASGQSANQTGTESVDHAHSAGTAGNAYNGQTGTESADHSHTYSSRLANRVVTGGGAATVTDSAGGVYASSGVSANHTHTVQIGGRSAAHTHTVGTHAGSSGNAGSNAAHDTVPPYLVVTHMIRAFETMTPAGEVIVPNSMDVVTPPNAAVSFNSQRIINLGTPTATADAVTKGYVDTATMARAMGGFKITGLGTPTADTDAATKAYVDTKATSGYTTSVTPALTAHTWSTSINHALNVTGMAVSAYEVATGENMDLDWKRVDANNVQLRAGVAMAANSYVLYVTGR